MLKDCEKAYKCFAQNYELFPQLKCSEGSRANDSELNFSFLEIKVANALLGIDLNEVVRLIKIKCFTSFLALLDPPLTFSKLLGLT